MSPEAQLAQHMALNWIGGGLLVILGGIVAFNEWRHRMTRESMASEFADAIAAHDGKKDAHSKALAVHNSDPVAHLSGENREVLSDMNERTIRIETLLATFLARLEKAELQIEANKNEHSEMKIRLAQAEARIESSGEHRARPLPGGVL